MSSPTAQQPQTAQQALMRSASARSAVREEAGAKPAPALINSVGAPASTLALVMQYQLTHKDQDDTAAVIFALLRTVFLARWNELGNTGMPAPSDALQRLQVEAQQAAAQMVRTHNAALTKFIGEYVASYVAHHTDESDLPQQLGYALSAWTDKLTSWKPQQIAGWLTRKALSLADLFFGGSQARYTVDGPELTDASCALCRTYYQRVLTAQQAWQLVFPAHPECEHTMRVLTAQELASYRASGSF